MEVCGGHMTGCVPTTGCRRTMVSLCVSSDSQQMPVGLTGNSTCLSTSIQQCYSRMGKCVIIHKQISFGAGLYVYVTGTQPTTNFTQLLIGGN